MFDPIMGTTYVLQKNTDITYGNYLNHVSPINPNYDELDQSILTLPAGTKIDINRQLVSGHPDFGTSYLFEIDEINLRSFFEQNKNNQHEKKH